MAQGDPLDPKCEQDQDFISFDLIRMHTIGAMLGSAVVPELSSLAPKAKVTDTHDLQVLTSLTDSIALWYCG